MREYIIADSDRNDIGFLGNKCSIDIDIGSENDFQIVIPISEYDPVLHKPGNIFYSLDTEYGGILNNPKVDTKNGTITFTGDTPRGMLSKKIIEPPSGQAYRTTGNTPAGTIITTLLNLYPYGDLIKGIVNLATTIVQNLRYDRYCTLLAGATKILQEQGYRLEIKAEYDSEEKVVWNVYTVPIVDRSEQIELSQDGNINFIIQQNTYKYNHMICAGKGELQDRLIIHLYLDSGGNISETKTFTGADEQVYFYDYSSVESEEELVKSGKEKFKEINAENTQEMTVNDMDLSIGDIVGGREYITGITLNERVSKKIYKYNYGIETIEYKIGSDIK